MADGIGMTTSAPPPPPPGEMDDVQEAAGPVARAGGLGHYVAQECAESAGSCAAAVGLAASAYVVATFGSPVLSVAMVTSDLPAKYADLAISYLTGGDTPAPSASPSRAH